MAIETNSTLVVRTGGSGHDIVDAINEQVGSNVVPSYALTASGQLFSGAYRLFGYKVIGPSTLVCRFRKGGASGTIAIPSETFTAGREVALPGVVSDTGWYFEIVSGTGTVVAFGEEIIS